MHHIGSGAVQSAHPSRLDEVLEVDSSSLADLHGCLRRNELDQYMPQVSTMQGSG